MSTEEIDIIFGLTNLNINGLSGQERLKIFKRVISNDCDFTEVDKVPT